MQVTDHGFDPLSYSQGHPNVAIPSLTVDISAKKEYLEDEPYMVPNIVSNFMPSSQPPLTDDASFDLPNSYQQLAEMSNNSGAASSCDRVKQEDNFHNFLLQNSDRAASPKLQIIGNNQHPAQLSYSLQKFDHFKRHASLPVPVPFSSFMTPSEEDMSSESHTAPIQYPYSFEYSPESSFDPQTPNEFFNAATSGSMYTDANMQPHRNFDTGSSILNMRSYPTSNRQRSTKGKPNFLLPDLKLLAWYSYFF